MTKEEFVRDVYEASYRRLVTQLIGPCGDVPTAEEVVQEAFVRAIAQGAAFRRTDNPEAWLRQVAVNPRAEPLAPVEEVRRPDAAARGADQHP